VAKWYETPVAAAGTEPTGGPEPPAAAREGETHRRPGGRYGSPQRPTNHRRPDEVGSCLSSPDADYIDHPGSPGLLVFADKSVYRLTIDNATDIAPGLLQSITSDPVQFAPPTEQDRPKSD
jgi:hypothetical protein